MTCREVSGAIFCSRGPEGRRRRSAERPRCRVPGCPRYATQARWGCRPHWYRLSSDLRNRLFLAERDDCAGAGWRAAADEADRWIADHPEATRRPDRRQQELLL